METISNTPDDDANKSSAEELRKEHLFANELLKRPHTDVGADRRIIVRRPLHYSEQARLLFSISINVDGIIHSGETGLTVAFLDKSHQRLLIYSRDPNQVLSLANNDPMNLTVDEYDLTKSSYKITAGVIEVHGES